MRVTLLNQFYAPDISPTAQLAASLAEHRAGLGDEVTVITGRAGYLEGLATTGGPTTDHALRIRRVWTPDLGKGTVARRLGGYVSFLAGAAMRVLTLPRQDVVIAMTTPPFVVVLAVLHRILRRRSRVILWSMDCYPDAAERFSEISPGGVASRILRAVNRWAFRRIDTVVCLDGAMKELLESQYAPAPGRPTHVVIPNWERAELFPPQPVNPWLGYDELGIGSRTRILYLGNIGVGHRFDTVLDAAAQLADEAAFVFIGGGARLDELKDAVTDRGVTNVVFHEYVAKTETPAVMAGADAALITLDERSLGVMSPSKLHANLAAGLPVIYVGPEGSNVDEAISQWDCGTSLREGDVAGVVEAARSLAGDTDSSHRARRAFDEAYNDRATLPQWDALLDHPTT